MVVQRQGFEQTRFGIDEVALENDIAHLVAIAFAHTEDDADAVFLVKDFRRGDLPVHIAVLHEVGTDGLDITLQRFFLQNAITGKPGEHTAFLEGHVTLDVVGIDLLEAFHGHFLDIELAAFLDLQDQSGGSAFGTALHLIGDFGKVEAFLTVKVRHLLEVFGKHLLVEHVARMGGHGFLDVVDADFLGTFHAHVFDARLFGNGKDQHRAFHGGLYLGGNVIEVAEIPDIAHVGIDGVLVDGVALLALDAHEDAILIEELEALDPDVGNAACTNGAGGGRGGSTVVLGNGADHLAHKGIHHGMELKKALAFQMEGFRSRGRSFHKLHIEAEAFAELVEAAVHSIAGLGGAGAIAGAQVAFGLALSGSGGGNGREAMLGNGFAHQGGYIAGKLCRRLGRIDGKGQYQHSGCRRTGRSCPDEEADGQTSQTRKKFAHRALQISVQGSGPSWPPVPGYASL